MRVPAAEHTEHSWRIHQIAPDFRVLDVHAYPAPGAGPDDLALMLAAIQAAEASRRDPLPVRFLFGVRVLLGKVFDWDGPEHGAEPAGRVSSLRHQLPADLRQPTSGMAVPGTPFTHLYRLPNEHAWELANKTVHAVAHHGWVQTGEDEFEMRMAVMVKTNGLLGRVYLAAIAPFRFLIVYPAMTRKWERAWRDRFDLLGDDANLWRTR